MKILIRFDNCTIPLSMINRENIDQVPPSFIVESDDPDINTIGYAKKIGERYTDTGFYFGMEHAGEVAKAISAINDLLETKDIKSS